MCVYRGNGKFSNLLSNQQSVRPRARVRTTPARRASLQVGGFITLAFFAQPFVFISKLCSLGRAENTSRPLALESFAVERRCCLVAVGIALGFSALVYRLVDVQTVQHDQWLARASQQHTTTVTIEGARGSINDSSGRPLAVSVEAVSIGAHPRQIADVASAAKILAPMLSIDERSLSENLSQKKNFVWLARGVRPEVRDAISGANLKGLAMFQEFRRVYPQRDLASPIIGRVSRAGQGQAGAELVFDKQLRAPQATHTVRRDARGRFMTAAAPSDAEGGSIFRRAYEESEMQNPLREEGQAVTLTVDSYVQKILESEFDRARSDSQATQVYGMVMDADSGEILGLAQTDRFNPNQLENVSPKQLRNAVTQNSFEPGSTFKPIVAALALDRGLVGENELIDCENGSFKVSRHIIRDVHPEKIIPLRDVLVRSSNIGMAKLGARLDIGGLHRGLESFQFGTKTGVQLMGENGGILRPERTWREIDTATVAFGQGIAVNSLQLVRAYAAIANGGYLVEPTILAGTAQNQKRIRVLRQDTADTIAEMLAGVTEDQAGTGKQARIDGVRVAGKTGTAQKARVDGRGYDPEKVFASFIGFVDGQSIGVERRLVMFVGVDEPGVSPRWGGTLAAPAFRRSMERILSHLMVTEGRMLKTASVENYKKRLT